MRISLVRTLPRKGGFGVKGNGEVFDVPSFVFDGFGPFLSLIEVRNDLLRFNPSTPP
jgi:hypothetical protein